MSVGSDNEEDEEWGKSGVVKEVYSRRARVRGDGYEVSAKARVAVRSSMGYGVSMEGEYGG